MSSTVCGHKKLNKLDDSKKFLILKKGIGIKGENLLKQVRDQKQVRKWKQIQDGAKGSLYAE